MNRLALLALAAILGGGVAAAEQPSYDQGTTRQAPSGKHEWGLHRHFRGTVQAVDPSSGRLTVRDRKGATKDFMAGSNARIMSGKTTVSLDSVNVGDEVSVAYKGKGATPQAEKVYIRKGAK